MEQLTDLEKENLRIRDHALAMIRIYIKDGLARIPAGKPKTKAAMGKLMESAYQKIQAIDTPDYWRTGWTYPVGNPAHHVTMAMGGKESMVQKIHAVIEIGKTE